MAKQRSFSDGDYHFFVEVPSSISHRISLFGAILTSKTPHSVQHVVRCCLHNLDMDSWLRVNRRRSCTKPLGFLSLWISSRSTCAVWICTHSQCSGLVDG
uniref:Uncharacterized protein n=1 Tax=Trypanosoma congolense (strain IL3000) TaxID=1068625 RepID=G0ULN7_TRYCI|nr:hypothetical protein, unlikely [Trypanosoma congolense IL3000]